MAENTAWILLAIALVIVAMLGGYACVLRRRLAKRRLAMAAQWADEAQRAQENLLENLQVIAQCMLDDQMNLTEGCLRARLLLDLLEEGRYVFQDEFVVFDTVHQRARHLDTHEAREALSKKERRQQDAERRAIEEQHESSIRDGARSLFNFCVKKRAQQAPAEPLFHDATQPVK